MDWSPLWISLNTAVPASVITFFLGIYAAYGMTRLGRRVSRFVDVVFTLPLVLPPTVVGFLLLLLLGKNAGLGRLLADLGIQVIFSRIAAIIAAVFVSLPLMYRSSRAAFDQLDRNLIHAGRTLGMSESRIFWRIVMPNALPGIVSGGILAFARALGEFGATLMVAGNIEGKTRTMPLAVYMAIQTGNRQEAVVWVIVLIAISIPMVFLMGRFASERRKESVKEEGL
jgi:molybdate transport system permease protein